MLGGRGRGRGCSLHTHQPNPTPTPLSVKWRGRRMCIACACMCTGEGGVCSVSGGARARLGETDGDVLRAFRADHFHRGLWLRLVRCRAAPAQPRPLDVLEQREEGGKALLLRRLRAGCRRGGQGRPHRVGRAAPCRRQLAPVQGLEPDQWGAAWRRGTGSRRRRWRRRRRRRGATCDRRRRRRGAAQDRWWWWWPHTACGRRWWQRCSIGGLQRRRRWRLRRKRATLRAPSSERRAPLAALGPAQGPVGRRRLQLAASLDGRGGGRDGRRGGQRPRAVCAL